MSNPLKQPLLWNPWNKIPGNHSKGVKVLQEVRQRRRKLYVDDSPKYANNYLRLEARHFLLPQLAQSGSPKQPTEGASVPPSSQIRAQQLDTETFVSQHYDEQNLETSAGVLRKATRDEGSHAKTPNLLSRGKHEKLLELIAHMKIASLSRDRINVFKAKRTRIKKKAKGRSEVRHSSLLRSEDRHFPASIPRKNSQAQRSWESHKEAKRWSRRLLNNGNFMRRCAFVSH